MFEPNIFLYKPDSTLGYYTPLIFTNLPSGTIPPLIFTNLPSGTIPPPDFYKFTIGYYTPPLIFTNLPSGTKLFL